MNLASTLPTLLGLAWLLPLASFVLIVFFGKYMGKHGKGASYVAAGAIITAFVSRRTTAQTSTAPKQMEKIMRQGTTQTRRFA
jgi:hypothetical protein